MSLSHLNTATGGREPSRTADRVYAGLQVLRAAAGGVLIAAALFAVALLLSGRARAGEWYDDIQLAPLPAAPAPTFADDVAGQLTAWGVDPGRIIEIAAGILLAGAAYWAFVLALCLAVALWHGLLQAVADGDAERFEAARREAEQREQREADQRERRARPGRFDGAMFAIGRRFRG